jgi:hypothetical protein
MTVNKKIMSNLLMLYVSHYYVKALNYCRSVGTCSLGPGSVAVGDYLFFQNPQGQLL